MKTMKKFLAAAMAVTSIMAFAPMSAFAANETGGSTNVEFDAPHVSPEFIITIPQSVALSSSTSTATITATDVYLDTEKHTKINVTLDSASNTEDGNTFHAVNTENGSSATYTINNGGEDNIAVGGIVAEFTEDGSKTLTFSAPEGATYAGTHTEVLTFGIRASNQYLDAAVGNTVTFGNYDWYVIAKTDTTATLLMKDVMEKKAYHSGGNGSGITWADCSLRTYLNNTFYNSFSDTERAMIAETTCPVPTNPDYSTNAGNETKDKIYLLSIAEAQAIANNSALGASVLKSEPSSVWWLRSPGDISGRAAAVGSDGSLITSGNYVGIADGVRPALNLEFD